MKTFKKIISRLFVLVPAVLFSTLSSPADIFGPYATDGNTLFLVHFDESTGASAAANAGSKGGNFYTVTNTTSGNGLPNPPAVTTLLGYASFSGFGNAVSGTNSDGLANGLIGYDGNNSGSYEADVQGGPASPDAIALTNLNIGNGGASSFTIEALIRPTVININQEILCTDDYNGSRGFQFKITSAGQLQFQMINGNTVNLTVAIPNAGINAFAPNNWYHVAVTYDGAALKLYWTKMDATIGAANQIGATTWNGTTTTGAIIAPLDIGSENRGSAGESFRGLIDEVRISSVARGANQMQFFSSAVTISQSPVSQNIDNYQPVTFNVTASSIAALGYQWFFGATPIADATNASYSIASVELTNTGNYSVIVTNLIGGSATSGVAVLTVGAANFLAHRWSFTGDTSDSIGGANGANHGNATVTGSALVLDGTTDTYLELPPHLLSGLSAVTFDFWATFGANGNNNRVFDFGNTNFVNASVPPPQNYVFFSPRTGGGTHNLGITGGSSEFQQTLVAPGILDGQTVHVTCVVDPPNHVMSIYTNGVLEATTNTSVALASLNDELCWIGRSLFTADAYLNGSIDELRIYNGALSASSIQQSDSAGPGSLLSDGPVQLVTQPADTVSAINQPATFSGSAVGHLPIHFQWFENGSAIPDATNSAYTLTATSDKNGHAFQLRATNNVAGTIYSAVSTNATLTVHVPVGLTWAGTGANWDLITANWTTDGNSSQTTYNEADSVIFNALGAGQPTVNLTQAFHPATVSVNSSSVYTFSGGGSISGAASLTKSGSGTLIINTINDYSGGTTISGGTLQAGDATVTGTLGSGSITNNATLSIRPASSATVGLANSISGTGALTINGNSSSTVALSGTNSFSGGVNVLAGSLRPQNATALGTGTATVASGGQIYAAVNVDLNPLPMILNGSGIANDGALRKGGAGATSFGGAITLGSDTTIGVDSGSTLNLTNGSGINGSVANANLILAGGGAGNVTGALALGAAGLTVNGGNWTLNSSINTYSGQTILNAGTLNVGAATAFGTAPASFMPDQITLNGGTLGAFSNVDLSDNLRGVTVNSVGGFVVASNSVLTISNVLAGSGTITKSGPGMLILNGNNSFAGTFNTDTSQAGVPGVNDGITRIASPNAFAGVTIVQVRNNNAGYSTLQLDGINGSVTFSPIIINWSGRNNLAPAFENFRGDNTFSPLQVSWVGGGGIYPIQSDTGTLTVNTMLPNDSAAGFRTALFAGSGNINMSGVIQDIAGTMTNGVIKTGTGTLTLQADNTYTGGTTISNGVLLVDGSLATGNAVTNVGGTIGGTGTIGSPVLIRAGGTLAPGDFGVGTLTINNNLTIAGNVRFALNTSLSPSNSLAVVSGALANTGTGTLTLTNLGPVLAVGNSFKLFSQPVANGGALTVVGGNVVWNNNLAADGSVSVAAIVVPRPVIDHVSISSTNLVLSGSNGTSGGTYYLLSSTNLALPLSSWTPAETNTFTGSGLFAITNAILPGTPQNFYLLQLP